MNGHSRSHGFWATVLQWSRLGTNALVFLLMARFLSLAEIGAFATAIAPVRLLQVLHRTGIADSVIIAHRRGPDALNALFVWSVILGVAVTCLLVGAAPLIDVMTGGDLSVGAMILVLSALPLLSGLAAVPEGLLRQRLAIKALALRTLASQIIAAAVCFAAAALGAGAWTLVLFALTNGTLAMALAVGMAGWRPTAWPRRQALRAAAPDVALIAGRDLVNGAVQPLLQLAVGLCLGLSAAGAFQIAQRFISLLDSMALSPIRYLALPKFARLSSAALPGAVVSGLRLAALVTAYIYLGAFAAAPQILTLFVGADHAEASAALLRLFCLIGLLGALAVILTQALTATGATRLVFLRSAALFVLTALIAAPALTMSAEATATAAVAAALIVLIALYHIAPPVLHLSRGDALGAIGPALIAGTIMSAAVITATATFLTPLSAALLLPAQIAFGTAVYTALLPLLARGTVADLRAALVP